jgi:hypothetical protein
MSRTERIQGPEFGRLIALTSNVRVYSPDGGSLAGGA